MPAMQEVIGIVAGTLATIAYIPYIIGMLRGRTRPNKASWIIWTIVGGLLAITYFLEGDLKAIWVPLVYFIGPLVIAVLSFRYGYSRWSKLDYACVVFAIISIIPWIFSNDPTITLLLNVMIDTAGAIPTYVKSYREPETEDFTAWFIFFIANTLELFAISKWNLSAIYPIYLFVSTAIIFAFITKFKFQKKSTHVNATYTH